MGWVYALVSPSMQGIVKFGATERDPAARLREANAPDTFRPPEPYVIAAATEVDDPFAVERGIHAILASRRIHPRREFFCFPTDEARALLALIPGVLRVPGELEAVDMNAAILEEATALIAHEEAAEPPVEEHPTAREQPETRSEEQILRAWVDQGYARLDRSRKEGGMRLRDLYDAYVAAVPGVHARPIPKIRFGAMIRAILPGIGPHLGLYLLQAQQTAQATQAQVAQDNSEIRGWFDAHYTVTGRACDRIGATMLKQAYMTHARIDRLSDYTFRGLMGCISIPHKKMTIGMMYTGIRRTPRE